MSAERKPNDPHIERAVNELEQLVRRSFPNAQFQVSEGEDPDGVYLRATVDVPDTDEVLNLVIDRLVELQVDEHLPLYFVALRPRERVIADLKGHPLLSSRRRRVLHVSGILAP